MTPRQFEALYEADWSELARGLDALEKPRRKARKALATFPTSTTPPPGAARVAHLYRQCCEHLALARERAYPLHLVERLEALAARAHERIYRRTDYGLGALATLLADDIPLAVRALRGPVLLATVLFLVSTLLAGFAAWHDPHFVLHVVDARTVSQFDDMYGPDSEHLGRTGGDDAAMFGYYVMHNVGIAFECFAAGLTFGVGPLLVVVFNGVMPGAVAGYLVTRGDALRFFSFVVTHTAFEVTALVLAAACGMRLGQALLMPGRLGRAEALRLAALQTAPVVYGLFAMLVVAATLEAFWSSSAWVHPFVKFGVGGACWALVLAWLGGLLRRGRGGQGRA